MADVVHLGTQCKMRAKLTSVWNVRFYSSYQQQQVTAWALSYSANRPQLKRICCCLFSHKTSVIGDALQGLGMKCVTHWLGRRRRRWKRTTCQGINSLEELVLSGLQKLVLMLKILHYILFKFDNLYIRVGTNNQYCNMFFFNDTEAHNWCFSPRVQIIELCLLAVETA